MVSSRFLFQRVTDYISYYGSVQEVAFIPLLLLMLKKPGRRLFDRLPGLRGLNLLGQLQNKFFDLLGQTLKPCGFRLVNPLSSKELEVLTSW
jgi:hypothetical protein